MLTSYLKSAVRSLLRDRLTSFVNLFGLAVGLAGFIVIGLYVLHEVRYDRAYIEQGRTYRLVVDASAGDRVDHFASSAPPMGPTMVASFPDVEQTARLRPASQKLVVAGERRFYEDGMYYVDPTFFDVFRLPFAEGDAATALTRPDGVVLSHEAAMKYFPNQDALGQLLTFNDTGTHRVTGVLSPRTSAFHLDFDFLLPFQTFVAAHPEVDVDNWGWISIYTYVRLATHTDTAALEKRLTALMAENFQSQTRQVAIRLQPVEDIHLHPGLMGEIASTVSGTSVYTLLVVAILILLISCMNYVNLATAQAMRRSREIGVRKVLGAGKRQLVAQYLGESTMQVTAALLLSVGLAEGVHATGLFGTLPLLALRGADATWVLPVLVGLVALVGLLSGAYPALVLARVNATRAVKGPVALGRGRFNLRNVLVVGQFAASIVLLAGTLVVVHQLDYLRSKDLGFDTEHVVVVPMFSDEVRSQYGTLKAALGEVPQVASVSASRLSLDGDYGTTGFIAEGHPDETIPMRLYPIHFDFAQTLGMQLVEGRGFAEDRPADMQTGLVLNQAAARLLGWEGHAVGRRLQALSYATGDRRFIGVVKDFNYTSLREKVAPLVLFARQEDLRFMYVRLNAGDPGEALAQIESVWRQRVPAYPFTYRFLDDRVDSQYRSEAQFAALTRAFAVLALLVAGLGLFGLAAFMAVRRTKEIGIRKVHGATVTGIMLLLIRHIVVLVGVSTVIALPVAILASHRWLSDFAYRIDPGAGTFAAAVAVVFTVGLLSFGYQAVRAALTNPVKTLRHE